MARADSPRNNRTTWRSADGAGGKLAQGLSFVSPAANIVPPTKETSGSEKPGTTRRNPVALEISVTVSGSRPSGAGGSQDLFSEETKTVLVFEDGAVIG